MFGKRTSSLLTAAGVIAVLPLMDGCRFGGGFDSFSTLDIKQTSNARVAYLTLSSKPGNPPITGSSDSGGTGSANIVADGAHASMTPDFNGIKPQKDLPIASASPELYGDGSSSIYVERQTGLNEQDDTFLTYHESHDGNTTMYARGYVGTRTDAGVITNLRKSAVPRSATYTGTGFANVGQGGHAYEIDGDLLLTADFSAPEGKNALSGSITDASVTAPTADNPDGINQVKFKGSLRDNEPDYGITDIELATTSANVTLVEIDDGGGTGSFFGSKAQGTMGVFAGAGVTSYRTKEGKGKHVNVIGSFAGKATTAP